MRIQYSLPIILLAATQLGATDCGTVIRDPGFDLWCGGDLCTWKVVRGDVKRVDTWHEGDSGVELVGLDAAIAQLTPVDHHDGTCIRFDFLANVDENAEARLDIDVYGDGSIDHTERIATSNWNPISYKLRIAAPFTGIRFELAKVGPGKAAFANIAAEIDRDCPGTPITHGLGPLGALCAKDADCKSNLCRVAPDPGSSFGVSQRCVACEATTCGANEACGIAEPIGPVLAVPIECVPAAGDEIGEQCASGAECASGICNGEACSACDATHPCPTGEPCQQAWQNGPSICSPGLARRAPNEPCVADADCISGHCNGALRNACRDNRPCGNDTNCPVEGGLMPGACTTVGVQGGTCQ